MPTPRVIRRFALHLVIAAALSAALFALYDRRWDLYMLGVPSMHDLPLDPTGYEIQPLPYSFAASFADGDHVYAVNQRGEVFLIEDADPTRRTHLGDSGLAHPRSIFVSSRGVIFIGGNTQVLLRSSDRARTWTKALDVGVWRMDEDNTGRVFVGNYSPRDQPDYQADLFASDDDGLTWRKIFSDPALDHIHTVRFDARHGRIYLAAGDGPTRGQAVSDDGGVAWRWLATGRGEGHTDVAFTDEHIVWGSDDSYGRVVISPRNVPNNSLTRLFSRHSQVWFVVAEGRQVYAGTFCDQPASLHGAYLIASDDEGRTWRKVMEVGAGERGLRSFDGDSRRLTRAGWLYFRDSSFKTYRIRRAAP